MSFALEQLCFWVVTWLEFLYGHVAQYQLNGKKEGELRVSVVCIFEGHGPELLLPQI